MENNLGSRGNIKVVAFDFDGVITDLNIDWGSAIRLASKVAGYDVRSLLAFYENSYDTPIFQVVSKEIEKVELEALKNAKLTPFIMGFFERLSKIGVEMYVVSMQSSLVVERFLQQHNLAHYFREVLARERFPSKKAQISYILTQSGVNPNRILLIDDLKKNITECKELGMTCFHFMKHQDSDTIRDTWKQIFELIQTHISS
jgi:HAD superfamily hydrolase (TIGR01509 family)